MRPTQPVRGWVPALVNLADLNREQGRDAESAGLFALAIDSEPQNADVRQAVLLALGLTSTQSRRLLAKHRGVLGSALEELQGGQ